MTDGFNFIQLFYGGEVAEGKVFSPLPVYCSMISVSIGLIVFGEQERHLPLPALNHFSFPSDCHQHRRSRPYPSWWRPIQCSSK